MGRREWMLIGVVAIAMLAGAGATKAQQNDTTSEAAAREECLKLARLGQDGAKKGEWEDPQMSRGRGVYVECARKAGIKP